jgi:hypothetical protein
MKKFSQLKKNLKSNEISHMSESELKFITGGGAPGVGGSQTSATSGSTCCDSTCVCRCTPK